MRRQLRVNADDNTYGFFFFFHVCLCLCAVGDGRSPVARQVVHAGVHACFHEHLIPRFSQSGVRMKVEGSGHWVCAVNL